MLKYGLVFAEMNPDEQSQGIAWQGRAGGWIGIGGAKGRERRGLLVRKAGAEALVLSSVACMSISVAVILCDAAWEQCGLG